MKKQKQSFVVLGLGRFGSSVARSLCELGHEVLAVDRDEKLVEAIAPDVTQAVQANAVDEDALVELGVQNFGFFSSLTKTPSSKFITRFCMTSTTSLL